MLVLFKGMICGTIRCPYLECKMTEIVFMVRIEHDNSAGETYFDLGSIATISCVETYTAGPVNCDGTYTAGTVKKMKVEILVHGTKQSFVMNEEQYKNLIESWKEFKISRYFKNVVSEECGIRLC